MPRDIFIFVPAYNVRNTLAEVLEKISPEIRDRSRILVIDDGSSDGTASSFQSFCKKLHLAKDANVAHFSYCRYVKNRGYGAVVKYGLRAGVHSGAKYVACLHGDGQYPAEKLDEFIAEFERRDALDCSANSDDLPQTALLQGSRRAIAGDARKGGMPLHKRIGGAVLTWIENLAFSQKLTDRHSGFIVYSADFLKTVDLNRLSPSFDIDLELISIADSAGFALGELPIPTRYAGEKSNLNVVTYGLRVLKQTFRRVLRGRIKG